MTSLRINILACIAYFISGYIGLALAIPPSNASPIWPASGVALAIVLSYGYKSVPGLLTGAYLVQLISFLDPESMESILVSISLGFVIALGSIISAIVGAKLIEKIVGVNDPLIQDHQILRFLMLGGPVSCVISATVGSLIIMLADVIHTSDFLLTWGVWWVGDSIGVLIVTPIMMILFGQPRELWQSRVRTVLYPLLIVLSVVTALFEYGKHQDVERITAEFNRQVTELHAALVERLKHHLDITRSLQSLFVSSNFVDSFEFESFTRVQLETSPDIQALEWIIRLNDKNREVFKDEIGHDILEPDGNGQLVPAAVRPEYYVIRYVVPDIGNKRAYGFNVAANPAANEALIHSRDTAEITATKPIKLIQDFHTPRIGTVIYAPVYRLNALVETIDEKREELIGYVAVVFRIEDKIHLLMDNNDTWQLGLKITDYSEILYNDAGQDERHDLRNISLDSTREFPFANRTWRFTYHPTLEFFNQQLYWHTWWLLLGGLLLSSLTGMGLLMLTGRTLRTEEQVRQRTLDLQRESGELRLLMNKQNRRNRILQEIAGNIPLKDLFELIIRICEEETPGSICSILLLDEDGEHIRHGAAPNLPDEFNQKIDGAKIGIGVGSCGTAMYNRERVIVDDIDKHPYWQDYLELARLGGVKACWSQPVLGNNQQVLGSFAIYYRNPTVPTDDDIKRIEEMARFVSIAIERTRKEVEIRKLAFFDSLTNLPNRRLLLERLEFQLAGVKRNHDHGALLFIDMDNFKNLNDSMGHQFGDKLLVKIADRIQMCIRDEDTAARLGGDEFIILIRNTHQDIERMTDQAHSLALRIKYELNQPFDLDGYIHHTSPSIGINFISYQSSSPEEIIKQADTAMYTAKAQGRNCICFYHPDMQKYAENRLQVEKDLRQAIHNQHFYLQYQVQFDTQNRLMGMEALIRWNHPEKGMVFPDQFIPIAEETGLIVPMGIWVIEEVCQLLHKQPEISYIAINISPVQLRQVDFVSKFKEMLQQYQIERDRIILEMTEQIMIENLSETREKLRKLREMGIGISIDDFGTGYSSLAYLKSLPISQIKIDKAFVKDISIDIDDKAIIESIIIMAKHFNLTVIAEGIETELQKQMLVSMGCSGYQGYLFGRPMEIDELLRKYY